MRTESARGFSAMDVTARALSARTAAHVSATAASGVLSLPKGNRAGLFNLYGALTQTARLHAAAWKDTFDAFLFRRCQPDPRRASSRPRSGKAGDRGTAGYRYRCLTTSTLYD